MVKNNLTNCSTILDNVWGNIFSFPKIFVLDIFFISILSSNNHFKNTAPKKSVFFLFNFFLDKKKDVIKFIIRFLK